VARTTLQTVADKVGVSRMTVSNAFSRPDQLSAELRDRILAAADELGYVGPDPAARALARGTTGVVGIMLTSVIGTAFSDEVATQFLASIVEGLAPYGLSITLLSSEETAGHVPARDVPMDGTLVYHCDPTSPALGWLQRRKLPLVFVDQDPDPGVPSINVDDRGGARQAAEHLIALGHRRIGIVNAGVVGPHGLQTEPSVDAGAYVTTQRLLGWREALAAAGIDPVVIKQRHTNQDAGYDALGPLLDADPDITAVLCFADTMAHGVMLAAQDRGLDVPADLSIVGFDDSPMAARLRPPLTTVRQDVAEKGRSAADLLIRTLQPGKVVKDAGSAPNGDSDGNRHILLPTELIVRGSTAAPRR
jgi:DNA-binding LacI/PurR family transcriptional regulator